MTEVSDSFDLWGAARPSPRASMSKAVACLSSFLVGKEKDRSTDAGYARLSLQSGETAMRLLDKALKTKDADKRAGILKVASLNASSMLSALKTAEEIDIANGHLDGVNDLKYMMRVAGKAVDDMGSAGDCFDGAGTASTPARPPAIVPETTVTGTMGPGTTGKRTCPETNKAPAQRTKGRN